MTDSAYLRFSAALVFVILGLWLGAEIFTVGEENSQTFTAEYVSVSDEISLAGFIVRDEAPICAEGDILVLPAEGQWLCGGETAAVSRDAAKTYFDYASGAAAPVSAADISEAASAFYVSKNPESRRSASAVLSALLFGKEKAENEHLPLPRETVSAVSAGYFTRFCDGHEGLKITDDFSSFHAKIPENCIGKTVGGDGWFFVAETDKKTAEKLKNTEKLTLDGYPAELWEVGGGRVVFRVKRGVAAHLTDREKTLTLTLCEYEGIRLPKSAVSGGEDGNFIRIQHADGAETLAVEIIYSEEDSVILRGEGLLPGMRVLPAQQ